MSCHYSLIPHVLFEQNQLKKLSYYDSLDLQNDKRGKGSKRENFQPHRPLALTKRGGGNGDHVACDNPPLVNICKQVVIFNANSYQHNLNIMDATMAYHVPASILLRSYKCPKDYACLKAKEGKSPGGILSCPYRVSLLDDKICTYPTAIAMYQQQAQKSPNH